MAENNKLGESLSTLRQAINILPNPVFVKDRNHTWVLVNDAFCEFFGHTRENLIGHSAYEIFSKCDAEKLINTEKQIFAEKSDNTSYENYARLDGKNFDIEVRKSYYVTSDGEEYLIGVLTDITNLIKRENELKAAEENALSALKAKAEFLANMSHEIRTPMNGVLGMAEVLNLTDLTPHQSDLVQTLRRSGEALLSIINDILDFSKLESGKMILEAEPFSVRNMVHDIISLLGVTARDKNLDIIADIDCAMPDMLVGDVGRIKQILTNLVGNAIKFTTSGHVLVRIRHTLNTDKTNVSFSVIDTGIGIAKDKINTVFNEFEQAEDHTTRIYGGTGLGLTISRNLTEAMGGKLSLTSELGKGSEFCAQLSFDVAEDTRPQTDLKVEYGDISNHKILLIDDQAINLEVLKIDFDHAGASVTCAKSVREGVEFIVNGVKMGAPFDLVITDYDMPDINGLQFVEKIRAHSELKSIKVIALSSVNDRGVETEFAAHDICRYFQKPVTFETLYAAVADAVSAEKYTQPRSLSA